jgi:transcriptional regulator with XRE-family HTH domain
MYMKYKEVYKMEGAKLIYWMAKKNITAEWLAHEIGVHPTYISNLRTGKRAGSIKVWVKISEKLGIHVKELISDDGQIQQQPTISE